MLLKNKDIEKWKNKAEVQDTDIKFLQNMVKENKKIIKQLNYRVSQCT